MGKIEQQNIVGTLVFERKDNKWHVQIFRAIDGTAIINRIKGASRTKPMVWKSDLTPEGWVNVQRPAEAKKYVSQSA